jgi:hypothetical protein
MIICGKIRAGEIYMRVAPRTLVPKDEGTEEAVAAPSPTATGQAIEYGRMLFESGQSRTHCHNQLEMSGWDEAEADCVAALEPVEDIEVEVDYEAELELLRDGIEEEAFMRSWH